MDDVTITFDNRLAHVKGSTTALASARRRLSYRVPGYRFTSAFKRGFWDGYKCVMRADGAFPAGLIHDVSKHLKSEGYGVIISDERGDPPEPDARILDITNDIVLSEHQQAAINSIRRHSRGVVYQDVSAGKSVIIAEAVRQMGVVPALVVVGRKELLRQQYEQFVSLAKFPAKYVGVVGDGKFSPSLVTIATIQTIRARLGKLPTAGATMAWLKTIRAVHFDECHHLPADSYAQLAMALPEAYFRPGYSATPHKSRTDDKLNMETYYGVTGITGPVISYLSATENIESGRAVGASIFMVDAPGEGYEETDGHIEYTNKHGEHKRRVKRSYALAVENGIVQNEGRNKMIVRLAQKLGRKGPVIILCNRIEHGKVLRSMMLSDGIEEVS